ncbi:MAG: cyclic nucleotide-binding domain-containing protein [Bacteroidota bacterium]
MRPPSSLPDWLRRAHAEHEALFEPVDMAPGDVLFEEGDEPDALFVVREGTLDVCLGGTSGMETVAEILAGEVVGEMGVLTGLPRTATIRAPASTEAGAVRLWRLSREAFERIRRESPGLGQCLAEAAVPRWRRVLLTEAFQRLFGASLSAAALHELQNRVVWRTLRSGETACCQGDDGDSMYLLVSGRVVFEVPGDDGQPVVVGEAGAGEVVGEFSLMTNAPRSASVVAARQTSYVEVGRELFTELVAAHPEILFALTRQLAERQQRAHTHGSASLSPPTLTLSLLPAHADLDLAPLARRLLAELSRLGSVRLITSQEVEQALGDGASSTRDDDPFHAVVVQWLNEQEAETGTLVFLADPEWGPWTERCLSRSDRVFVVARPEADPQPGEVERRLMDSASRADRRLVLWHPPATVEPQNTARWLDPRPGYRHHHVREGDARHVARLARHIDGAAVGLVLGGGGARGYAHLGVFRALEELDVPVDHVGGASFGALIGAGRASETPAADLLARCADFAYNRQLFDRTLPIVALNASHRLTQFCRALFGDQQMEDLWVPFFATAVNLTRGESVVIRRGPVWLAVRKSIAVPGIFAPVVDAGELIVDGGVLNNFPVDVMLRESGSARVLGVRIAAGGATAREYDMTTAISGWRALLRRLNPFARTFYLPTLSRVLTRTLFVGSAPLSDLNARRADLTVTLDVRASLMNFEPYRRIAEDGYDQALEPLRGWAEAQPDLGPAAAPVA